MLNNSKKHQRGFSLIELLVVIGIIGLLSSIVIMGISTSRAKARDAKRIHDLNEIKAALIMYYSQYGNWLYGTGSPFPKPGCGSSNQGNGWFNYSAGGASSYTKSINQCLIDAGVLDKEIVDPLMKGIPSNQQLFTKYAEGFSYMKYTCSSSSGYNKVYLLARLETKPSGYSEGMNTFLDGCSSAAANDTDYGMNYYVVIE